MCGELIGAGPPSGGTDGLDPLSDRREARPPVSVLQRADVVADRRGARLVASVSTLSLFM